MTPSAEEFARWREDSVTQWVFAAIEAGCAANRDEWIGYSWERGVSNPTLLAELRTRSDAYRALIDTSFEGWCEINGDEPIYE